MFCLQAWEAGDCSHSILSLSLCDGDGDTGKDKHVCKAVQYSRHTAETDKERQKDTRQRHDSEIGMDTETATYAYDNGDGHGRGGGDDDNVDDDHEDP